MQMLMHCFISLIGCKIRSFQNFKISSFNFSFSVPKVRPCVTFIRRKLFHNHYMTEAGSTTGKEVLNKMYTLELTIHWDRQGIKRGSEHCSSTSSSSSSFILITNRLWKVALCHQRAGDHAGESLSSSATLRNHDLCLYQTRRGLPTASYFSPHPFVISLSFLDPFLALYFHQLIFTQSSD